MRSFYGRLAELPVVGGLVRLPLVAARRAVRVAMPHDLRIERRELDAIRAELQEQANMLRGHAELIEARNAHSAAIREVPRLPARLLANARILRDRDAILPLLPKGKVCVEIGVAFGDFSEKMLRICEPSRFIAIDSFRIHEHETLWGRPTDDRFKGRTHEAWYRERFAEQMSRGQVEVLCGDSASMLESLPDNSLDIVYVDADHAYEAVHRELSIIRGKIRDDGIIILNDYTMTDVVGTMDAYGVIQAAHEFMLAEDWEMIYLALQNYMYCDVALRKVAPDSAT